MPSAACNDAVSPSAPSVRKYCKIYAFYNFNETGSSCRNATQKCLSLSFLCFGCFGILRLGSVVR